MVTPSLQATTAAPDSLRSPPCDCRLAISAELAGLKARLSAQTLLLEKEPLARHTTLRVGGPADLYVEPASESDLAGVLRFSADAGLPAFVLGRGSNLLIRDGGVRGVVICLAHSIFSGVEVRGERLHCGAGARLKSVAVEGRRHGLTGFEFLEGIPGSVGGGLRMNAGAMGSCLWNVVESVRFLDWRGQSHERSAGEMGAQYRSCPALRRHVALSAVLRGQRSDEAVIRRRMETFSRKRWESQPREPSAGCIFKNPAGIPAGRLIEELGLKGHRTGGAMVSTVHGNFLVNTGGATARDLLQLISLIQQRARDQRGVELETEVEILGEASLESDGSTVPSQH